MAPTLGCCAPGSYAYRWPQDDEEYQPFTVYEGTSSRGRRTRWPALGLHERREVIASLIDCAFVLPPPGRVEERLADVVRHPTICRPAVRGAFARRARSIPPTAPARSAS